MYLNKLTYNIIKTLKKIDIDDFKFILKTRYLIRNLMTKTKDKMQLIHQKNLVYNIPCKNCDKTYTGVNII